MTGVPLNTAWVAIAGQNMLVQEESWCGGRHPARRRDS